jgi:hypothetical protein
MFLGRRQRPVHKANNFTAIYQPTVSKMWEIQYLTTLSIGIQGMLRG